ncbi:MAG: chemotaxis-specific protein-glutamate methyltransferase CheB [Pseudomonadota bacterium]
MSSIPHQPNPTLPIKVVVVDDSLTIRRWLSGVLAQDSRLEIVGMAGSAQEAREIIKATEPDILTLDIEMPGMDGLEFLTHLMRLRPMPVVMLASGIWGENAVAKRAMEIGAVACISKPQFPTQESMNALCDNIFAAATGQSVSASKREKRNTGFADKVLLVGASTGGVAAIETFLESLGRSDIPPIVIAQHMPQQYLDSFARRLDRMGTHDVQLSSHNMQLAPGHIRIAPSQRHQTCVAWHNNAWHIRETESQADQTYCPSVDVLFASAVPWAKQVGAVILTGLGSDGAKGMLSLRQQGARTLAQSRESCVVYGMPGAAHALEASENEAPIERIGLEILSAMQQEQTKVKTS